MKNFSYLTMGFCLACCVTNAQTNWHITGNSGTTAGTNFLGTTDAIDLVIKTNSAERLRIHANTGGLRLTNTTDDYILYGTKSGSGNGIYISKTSSTNGAAAIYGRTSGTGNGVYGYSAKDIGVYGYTAGTNTYGVKGYSSLAGVYGEGTAYGTDGYGVGTYGIGAWGNGINYGVYGYSADGTGINALNYSENNYALYVSAKNYRGLYCEGGSGWYSAYFNGDVYATGVFQSSDARLKKNIKDVDNALDIINRLHPKNYEFRSDGSYALMNLPKGSHFGLLAQDVEKILPNLVKEEAFNTRDVMTKYPEFAADSNGLVPQLVTARKDAKNETIDIKAVNYTELIPLMIKAMQELSKQNEAKDAKINDLQKQIDDLKKTVTINEQGGKGILLSPASLNQNTPNPFSGVTTIRYNLPQQYASARIVITDRSGKPIKEIGLPIGRQGISGTASLNIDASSFISGTYNYTLYVDGKLIETKQMIITK